MTRVLPSLGAVLAVLALAGCPGEKPEESGDTAVLCPGTLEQFCQREFGGACPTYSEVAAMECDGYHFAKDGEGDREPLTDDNGSPSCADWIVSCSLTGEPEGRTVLYFHPDEPGELRNTLTAWAECGGEVMVLGEPSC